MDSAEVNGVLVLQPGDELDLVGYLPLGDEVSKAMHQGKNKVVLDCQHVSYINSSAASVIVMLAARAAKAGGGICLANVSSGAKSVLEASGLIVDVTVHNTVDDAVNALS